MLSQKMCGLLLVLTFLGVVISCGHAGPKKKSGAVPVASSPWITDADRQCSSDSDCVFVPAGCCNCSQGGKQTAINKQFLAKFAAQRTYACSETLCMQVLSKDATCQAKNSQCVAGSCSLLFE